MPPVVTAQNQYFPANGISNAERIHALGKSLSPKWNMKLFCDGEEIVLFVGLQYNILAK